MHTIYKNQIRVSTVESPLILISDIKLASRSLLKAVVTENTEECYKHLPSPDCTLETTATFSLAFLFSSVPSSTEI